MGRIYAGKLYHGTDSKVLAMSPQQRKELENICYTVSKVSYDMLEEKGLVGLYSCPEEYKDVLGEIWGEFQLGGISPFRSRLRNLALFSYNDLFVTTGKVTASHYAKRGFIYGEQGYVAYSIYKAFMLLNLYDKLSKDDKLIFDKFEELTKLEKCPIIVEINDVDEDEMRFENGKPVTDRFLEMACFDTRISTHFRILNRTIDLTKDKIIDMDF